MLSNRIKLTLAALAVAAGALAVTVPAATASTTSAPAVTSTACTPGNVHQLAVCPTTAPAGSPFVRVVSSSLCGATSLDGVRISVRDITTSRWSPWLAVKYLDPSGSGFAGFVALPNLAAGQYLIVAWHISPYDTLHACYGRLTLS